jgi:hypothetical protein
MEHGAAGADACAVGTDFKIGTNLELAACSLGHVQCRRLIRGARILIPDYRQL